MSEPERINVGRKHSGGIFGGLFGNPVKEKVASEQYRHHIRKVIEVNPIMCGWLKRKLDNGAILYCPGCGIGSPTCHARILESELRKI